MEFNERAMNVRTPKLVVVRGRFYFAAFEDDVENE